MSTFDTRGAHAQEFHLRVYFYFMFIFWL